MTVVKHTKSNGIVLAKDGATTGVGPGQTNRITALELAVKYANTTEGADPDRAKGSVMASDAFFRSPTASSARRSPVSPR